MMRPAIVGLWAAMLSGCMLPVYEVPQDSEHARVHLGRDDNYSPFLWMCLDDTPYALTFDSAGYAKIPAGRRVTIGARYFGSDASCEAASSFVPAANISYYVDFEIENERCTALSYREGANNPVGLDFEHTLQPPSAACFIR